MVVTRGPGKVGEAVDGQVGEAVTDRARAVGGLVTVPRVLVEILRPLAGAASPFVKGQTHAESEVVMSM